MKTCVPWNARSELANARKFAKRGSGGAFGSGGGRFGSRSGGVGVPPGFFGSKKPAGLGMLATFSRFLMASPASRRPAFNPTRGSLVDCAAAIVTKHSAPTIPESFERIHISCKATSERGARFHFLLRTSYFVLLI